jgi:hypothetical protein
MMSRENVELFYRGVDAFNRRDWDAFVALTDDEIEVESRLVAMEGGYHGHEGLRRWWDDFLGAFPDYTIEVEELRDLGDVTLGYIRGWGHGADSATPIVDPFWQPMRWRDGKCIWWRNCSRGGSPPSHRPVRVGRPRAGFLRQPAALLPFAQRAVWQRPSCGEHERCAPADDY